MVITEGKRYDVRVARTLRFAPETIVVMERGSTDYAWFGHLTAQGSVVRHPPEGGRGLRGGRGASHPGAGARGAGPSDPPDWRGRGGEVPARATADRGVRPGEGRDVVFLTNHLTFGATTIAAIYQDRWQIELFFKALKQNLKIKTFVGTSADALKVQVWTALMPCCSSSTNHS
jgi:hypothetical protein